MHDVALAHKLDSARGLTAAPVSVHATKDPYDHLPHALRAAPRFAAIGNAFEGMTLERAARLEEFGRVMAEPDGPLWVMESGAPPGNVARFVKGFSRNGGVSIGRSPGKTPEEDRQRDMPTRPYTVIHQTGSGYAGAGLMAREYDIVDKPRVVFVFGGRTGTWTEVLAAYLAAKERGEVKVIGILDDMGDVEEHWDQLFDGVPLDKHLRIVRHRDPRELKRLVLAETAKLDEAERRMRETSREPAPPVANARKPVTDPWRDDAGLKTRNVMAVVGSPTISKADESHIDRLTQVRSKEHSRPTRLLFPTLSNGDRDRALLAKAKGVETVGVSPAHDWAEHRRRNLPVNGFDRIVFTGKAPFLMGIDLVEQSHAVVGLDPTDPFAQAVLVTSTYHNGVTVAMEVPGRTGFFRRVGLLKKPFTTIPIFIPANRGKQGDGFAAIGKALHKNPNDPYQAVGGKGE